MKIRLLDFLVLFSLFAVASPPGCAQTPSKPLTLEDCIRLAQSVPSEATMARQEVDFATLGVKRARGDLFPHSRIDTAHTYNSPSLTTPGSQSFLALNGVREYLGVLGVTQEFDTSGKLRAEIARARAERDAAEAGARIAQRDVRRAVVSAYYRLLLARHIEQALRDTVTEGESFEERTRKLVEAGEAARADMVKASASLAGLRQALRAAELDSRTANFELASFWTKDVTTPLEIEDVFEQTPAPEPVPGAAPAGIAPYLQRPEFEQLDAQRRGFLAEARRERAAHFPQPTVEFEWGIDANAVRARERGYALLVNMQIPIFSWFKVSNATKQFRIRAEQVETRRSFTERVFSKEYEAAQARVRNYLEQMSLTGTQVRFSVEDLRISRIRYDGGEGSALDVVTAQNQLAQARVSYYTSIANYLNAKADREVAAGR